MTEGHDLALVDGDPTTGQHWAICQCSWRTARCNNTNLAVDTHSAHRIQQATITFPDRP